MQVPVTLHSLIKKNIRTYQTAIYNDGQNGCCLAYIANTSNLGSNHFVHHCTNVRFSNFDVLEKNIQRTYNVPGGHSVAMVVLMFRP